MLTITSRLFNIAKRRLQTTAARPDVYVARRNITNERALALLERVALNLTKRSDGVSGYAHPNGFDKITLDSATSGEKLRLHIWWPRLGAYVSDLHDHRWDFFSEVLIGKMRMHVHRRATPLEVMGLPREATTLRQEIKYHRHGERQSFEATGSERKLVDLGEFEISSGNSYVFPSSFAHKISLPSNALLATLCISGPAKTPSSHIYYDEFRKKQRASLLPFSTSALQEKLERLMLFIRREPDIAPGKWDDGYIARLNKRAA